MCDILRIFSIFFLVFQLHGPDIFPRHCVFAHTEGIVTVTPTHKDAETFVDNQRIYETTMLQHGMTVRFGKGHLFRLIDPNCENVSSIFLLVFIRVHICSAN